MRFKEKQKKCDCCKTEEVPLMSRKAQVSFIRENVLDNMFEFEDLSNGDIFFMCDENKNLYKLIKINNDTQDVGVILEIVSNIRFPMNIGDVMEFSEKDYVLSF